MRRLILPPLALLVLGTATAWAITTVQQADASLTGVIAKLSPTTITVGKKEHHHLTCSVNSLSPALGTFAVGDRVRVACAGGMLVAISDVPARTRKATNDAVAPPGTTTASEDANVTSAVGPITALGEHSISVQT